MLKNISVEKSNLFAYLRFCVLFCEHKEKKKKMKRPTMENVLNTNVPINRLRCVCVYLHKPVCGDINLVYILTSKN